MFRTQRQLLGSRVREIKRRILHTHNAGLRKIYKDHVRFLESQMEGK